MDHWGAVQPAAGALDHKAGPLKTSPRVPLRFRGTCGGQSADSPQGAGHLHSYMFKPLAALPAAAGQILRNVSTQTWRSLILEL